MRGTQVSAALGHLRAVLVPQALADALRAPTDREGASLPQYSGNQRSDLRQGNKAVVRVAVRLIRDNHRPRPGDGTTAERPRLR
jgi:hypothetical protein